MRRISLILVLIATCSVAWAQPATTPKKVPRKHLDPSKINVIKAGDFAKAKK